MAVDEAYWRGVISGERRCPSAALLRPVLRGASWLYGAAAGVRRGLYERGVLKSHAAAAPVISVGNITTGGTGKSPLVGHVVRHLAAMGRRPAILTRGYKAVGGASDEATMLRQMTGAPVVVNADRAAGAAEAVEGGADVLVMDDGFQHIRLRRDLDIVAIDATRPFGYGAVLPRGMLREPLGALARADIFVLTRCDQAPREAIEAVKDRLALYAPAAPVVESVMKPVNLRSLDGRAEPAASLADKKVWAFCGLGNPEGFYRTLRGLAGGVLGETTFNDHHAYDSLDLRHVRRLAHEAGARLLVTTAKDAVKFPAPEAGAPIRWLEIDVDFTAGGEILAGMINKLFSGDPHHG